MLRSFGIKLWGHNVVLHCKSMWNAELWPFQWKLLSSAFHQCCSLDDFAKWICDCDLFLNLIVVLSNGVYLTICQSFWLFFLFTGAFLKEMLTSPKKRYYCSCVKYLMLSHVMVLILESFIYCSGCGGCGGQCWSHQLSYQGIEASILSGGYCWLHQGIKTRAKFKLSHPNWVRKVGSWKGFYQLCFDICLNSSSHRLVLIFS